LYFGVGLKGDIEELQEKSMGLQLISILCKQIKGKWDVNGQDGTEFKIVFPVGKDT
jgi:two-component sensor histidine kinase